MAADSVLEKEKKRKRKKKEKKSKKNMASEANYEKSNKDEKKKKDRAKGDEPGEQKARKKKPKIDPPLSNEEEDYKKKNKRNKMKKRENRDDPDEKKKKNRENIEGRDDPEEKRMKKKNREDIEAQDELDELGPRPSSEGNKKNRRNKKRRENRDYPEGRKRARGIITDERFASAHTDPRFQRVPQRQTKVPIDSRFARMFTDESFAASSAPVDKRGRPRKDKAVNPLLHYYFHEEEPRAEAEEELEVEDGDELRGEDSGSGLEPEAEEEEELSQLGSATEESSSSDDEEDIDDDDDEYSVNSDVVHYLMADHDDTPTIEHETHRLAIVNMDWDHIKAVDLYVVMNSCLPKGGQVLSVAIYPSEFGLKCMETEAVHGPSDLFNDNEEHSEDESGEIDDEKLRSYELNRLRYYYAVVVCDSSATANHIYKTLDGTELLKTSNVFDLRFIPDSMEFKHLPRDITTEAPTSYKEPDFHTRALQHSNVKLSWEEDEPQRKKILRRKFNLDQLDELTEYLASTDEETDDDDEHDNENEAPKGEDKKHIEREKLRALLESGDGSDAEKSNDKDMEITFNTGLEDLSKWILEKKDKKSETVWEAVLRKKREKKAARKTRSKYSSDDDSSDYDVQEAPDPDQHDDVFVDESLETDARVSKKSIKDSSNRRGKTSQKNKEPSPERGKEQEASRAELELLFADDQGGDQVPKGYNMKPKKAKGKKGKKEVPDEDRLPNVDVSEDPRFSALVTSHLYALDPTDPQFKRSAAYARQRLQKQKMGGAEKAIEDQSEQAHELVPSTDENLHPSGMSTEKEKFELSSTIKSLKRNLGTFKK